MIDDNNLESRNVDWYEWYCKNIDEGKLSGSKEGYLFTCPCCGYATLDERGGYEICVMCGWEDDGQDSHNADKILGGPNGDYSLSESRLNFDKYFTCYRPADKSQFDRCTKNRSQKEVAVKVLAPSRWKGRFKETDEILTTLKNLA